VNPAPVDPLALPSLPLTDRSQLPVCPAVYFALDGDRVLYIGRSVNLQQRWITHHRYSQLKGLNNVRIAWLECNDPSLLPKIEAALIEYFQPSLNGELIPLVASKPPRMIVYIEPELKAAAEKLAKKQRRSLSSLVCLLLEQAVKEEESPEKPATDKNTENRVTQAN
jgi:excinuclease UvrABC nuclease subunit